MTTFHTEWNLGQRVHIDGDTSIKAIVTAVCFRVEHQPQLEVNWLHNGDAKSAWITEDRLTKAEA